MAVRIAGVTIPNDKIIEVSLTYIFGIGPAKSKAVLAKAKVASTTRVRDLKEEEINRIREIIEKENLVEGDLRRDIASNVKRLKEIGCYRGSRHAKSLPARGQRTKTNSRTVRGNKRVTMGSGRVKAGIKT